MTSKSRASFFRLALRLQAIDFESASKVAQKNELLTEHELADLQAQKLNYVLKNAASRNAAYRKLFCEITNTEFNPSLSTALTDMPVLSKNDLAYVAKESRAPREERSPIRKRTSGSSGRPLALFKQRSGVAAELAVTWRSYGWYGVNAGDPFVRVWGRPLDWRKRAYNAIKNLAFNCVDISAFDVSAATLSDRLRKIQLTRPKLIYGYASALRALASQAIDDRVVLPDSISAIVSTAEPLDLAARNLIESAFYAPCREEYGCSEVGSIAHECSAGQMHVMADNLVTEVLSPGGSVTNVGYGELLVTDLSNELTPVIRYRVGDYCELTNITNCRCGSRFPILKNIHGRVEDTIVMPDGTRHHPAKICYLVDEINASFNVIEQFQVIQHQPLCFELRVVSGINFPIDQFTVRAQEIFSKSLHPKCEIVVNKVPAIRREPGGKFRIVKSEWQRNPR